MSRDERLFRRLALFSKDESDWTTGEFMNKTVGILHPGSMGVSVAASAQAIGHRVMWVSEGRSEKTRARAEGQGLEDAGSVQALCEQSDVIVSVCPPHAAEDLARTVLDCGFNGLYLDANATSPQRARKIGQAMEAAGVDFVDGGIIGGPAWHPNTTWLCLSGWNAHAAEACLSGGMLEVQVVGDEVGWASALKMCYGAYTKGTTALLAAILATAEVWGVRHELERQWARDDAGFVDATNGRVRRVTAKAWRFVGEMEEISETFEAAGLPGSFHQAAAEVYRRLSDFKSRDQTPELDEVLAALGGPVVAKAGNGQPSAPTGQDAETQTSSSGVSS
jgi:3-hydroxyisobutyrate dehydrogenase-like beta-hydroxyacid dehydrogenase